MDGRIQEDGGVSIGMETTSDGGAARTLDAEPLSADGDTLVWSDFGLGA